MDKEVMTEFAKSVGWGLFKAVAYTSTFFGLAYGFTLAGASADEAILYTISAAIVAFAAWFGIESAWRNAEVRVKHRREYGEDL